MTTPKANTFAYAKLINKKRNQSQNDIGKDISQLELQQQDQNENRKLDLSELVSDNPQQQQQQQYQNNNNYSFDQNQKQDKSSSKQSDPYEDNMNYINSLMQIKKQNEQRQNQKKANHARTKSSLGQYNSQQQNNHFNSSTHHQANKSSHEIEMNQDSKENNGLSQSMQPQIQHKSLSHRSLNETLPIFSKQNKNNSQINDNDSFQKSERLNESKIHQPQQNNLSFKIDSERKNIAKQQQYQQQQQQQQSMNKFNNQESISGNETVPSTGISQQKTDQTQFLQFLGSYVTYLSQPDESPSKSNHYQNNFFNTHNASVNNRYQQQQQQQQYQLQNNYSMKNEQLLQENILLKDTIENMQHEFKEVSYQNKLQMIEINKLIKEKAEDKKKVIQFEKMMQQMQQKYNDLAFKLKYTQDNLAKVRIDRENDNYTLKYALQQLQSQQIKNNELNTFKSNSKNSYSSHNFNFTSKGKESNHDLKFDEFENTSHFFSAHNNNQKQHLMNKPMIPHQKSPMNFSKLNRSNFQQENIYENAEQQQQQQQQMLNNTGIFNYPNQHNNNNNNIIEEDQIEKHNTSMKVQQRNMINYSQIQDHHDQEFDYDNDNINNNNNVYNNYNDSEEQFGYNDSLQHSQNQDKQSSFINNNNNYNSVNQLNQIQRNKKYHSVHMRTPSNDLNLNINQSYYQNFLQNKMINEGENKNGMFQQNKGQNISKKDIQQQYQGNNILKNSNIIHSQSNKLNYNNSNFMSGDYYQDISQSELQNSSLQLHQIE